MTSGDDPETDALMRRLLSELDGVDPADIVAAISKAGTERALARLERRARPLHQPLDRPRRLLLRVDIVGAKPPIWRRLSVPSDLTLDIVHEVMQAAFGWTDSHLHRFSWSDQRYLPGGIVTRFDLEEGEVGTLEDDVRLDQLLRDPGDRCAYTYDFGDDWHHCLTVESAHPLDDDRAVHCLDGRRAGPPEDVGGIHGYEELRAAVGKPVADDDLLERLEAVGLSEIPDEFDLAGTSAAMSRTLAAHHAITRLADEHSPVADLIRRCPPGIARLLAGYVAAARMNGEADPSPEDAAESTAVIRTFLRLIPRDGVRLTAAGYLPPATVVEMMAAFDPGQEWIGKANREDLTYPLLDLRASAVTLGLVRKRAGRLVLTAAGSRLRDDPVGLWHHLADRLPVERSDFGQDVGHLLLLITASASASTLRQLASELDLLASAVGWQFATRGPFGSDALDSVEQTRSVLDWARTGQLVERGRWRGRLDSDRARALARAALGDWS